MSAVDVIVAGAGPVGLVAANVLADAGVKVLLLEADTKVPTNLRASTFQPSTLDMLDRFDVRDFTEIRDISIESGHPIAALGGQPCMTAAAGGEVEHRPTARRGDQRERSADAEHGRKIEAAGSRRWRRGAAGAGRAATGGCPSALPTVKSAHE